MEGLFRISESGTASVIENRKVVMRPPELFYRVQNLPVFGYVKRAKRGIFNWP
jgi:hypothetical protein